jgi:hypothetical protein
LTHLTGSAVQRPTGVSVIHAVRSPQEEQARQARMQWTAFEGDVDWAKIDPEASVVQLHDMCRRGLPRAIPFGYLPEVLALEGLSLPEVEATVRFPQRVEIRPETKRHRYPTLGFWRGDTVVILGMRTPVKPIVIAAYWTSLLSHDTHRVNAVGGGGARKKEGLPKTLRQSVQQLRIIGCDIPDEWETATTPLPVTYHGKDLGKITVGASVQRRTVESDFQRTLRRVQAIRLREESQG